MTTDDDDSRPAKRTRNRGSTACAACRARRSKCDLVDAIGCHRCKQLHTECSLAQPGGFEIPYDRSSNGIGDDSVVLQRIAKLEQEVNLLKGQLSRAETTPLNRFDYSISTHQTQRTDGTPIDADVLAPVETGRVKKRNGEERDEAWYRRWADPEAFGLVHRGVKGKEELGLRDPLAEGVITQSQAEAAYQVFRFHFAAIHPHPTLLVVAPTIPSQPFQLCACLFYITHCPGSLPLFTPAQLGHLKTYVYANLNAYHRGCRASVEGIMAAFVLSHLPSGDHEETSELDPSRMIGLAYAQVREMGQSVFLDRLLALLEAGVPANQLEGQLNDARLFMSVINRSAWFAHSRCPWASLPVLVEGAQPKILDFLRVKGLDCDLDSHLSIEQECLGIMFTHSRSWQALQRRVVPGLNEVTAGNELVLASDRDLDRLLDRIDRDTHLRSKEYLYCHVIYCKYWVTVRNVWSIYRLPSPLYTEPLYTAFLGAMSLAARAAARLIFTCLERQWRLGHLPEAIGKAILFCFVALSTGIIHYQHHFPGEPLPIGLDVARPLEEIQTVLASSGTELAGHLASTKDRMAEYKAQLEWQRLVEEDALRGHPETTANLDLGEVFGWSLDGTNGGADVGGMLSGLENWWNWPTGSNEETAWGSMR